MKKLILVFSLLIWTASFNQIVAQNSFKEVEKQKIKEEKAREKAQKKADRKAPKTETAEPQERPDYLEKRTQSRKRGTVPKASTHLSNENRKVNANRKKNRDKGSKGLTKAAKNQAKEQKRWKKS